MVFNSYTFIAFFIIMLILHNLPFTWKVKKINLLLASYIFYAAWNPPFILLLWLSTIVDYFVGKALYKQENVTKKRLLLVISLIGNIGMLCFFKYGGFLLENFTLLMNAIGVDFHPAKPDIILPAGISARRRRAARIASAETRRRAARTTGSPGSESGPTDP